MPRTEVILLRAASPREIVRIFRALDARSIATARPLDELGLRDSQVLRRMVASAELRRHGPYRYYLDEALLTEHDRVRQRPLRRAALAMALAGSSVAFFLTR
jgi:hypothetical protein